MSNLIDRARAYLKDKVLDLADVKSYIEEYVKLYDLNKDLLVHGAKAQKLNDDLIAENKRLIKHINELNNTNAALKRRVLNLESMVR